MSCESRIADDWELMVEYADSNGNLTDSSIERAENDWENDQITVSEFQLVIEAANEGCSLSDAVSVSDLDLSVSQQHISAEATVSTPGQASVRVGVEFTLDGSDRSIEQTTVSNSGVVSVGYNTDEGTHEVCAEVRGVAQA